MLPGRHADARCRIDNGELLCYCGSGGGLNNWTFSDNQTDGAIVYRPIGPTPGGNGQKPRMQPAAATKPDADRFPKPLIEYASQIEEKPVKWLWHNRLETGALNLIASDPGAGKSLLTAALAAAITTGAAWPDSTHEFTRAPQSVVLITAEDDPHKSTVPRLRAAGAKLERVAILRQVTQDGRNRKLSLQRDLLAIEAAIREVHDVALIVLDPVDSYLGRNDSNANEEMREILEPLVAIAERHEVCFVVIKHLNKGNQTVSAMYRIAGSMAFVALPRTVSIIGADQDEKARKLFVPIKISHGPKPDALAYRVGTNGDGLPVVEWEAQTVATDADELLGGRRGPAPVQSDRATAWLRDFLADGPRSSKDVSSGAEALGVGQSTLKKAKDKLGVVATQVRDGHGLLTGWSLSLPDGGVQ